MAATGYQYNFGRYILLNYGHIMVKLFLKSADPKFSIRAKTTLKLLSRRQDWCIVSSSGVSWQKIFHTRNKFTKLLRR